MSDEDKRKEAVDAMITAARGIGAWVDDIADAELRGFMRAVEMLRADDKSELYDVEQWTSRYWADWLEEQKPSPSKN
jgi:hypothetical protein